MLERQQHPWYAQTEGAPELSKYLPFVSFDGLNEAQRQRIKRIIRILHYVTGDCWEPGNSRAYVSEYIAFFDSHKPIGNIEVRRFDRYHFWLQISLNNRSVFIFDPCGGPADSKDLGNDKKYIPYFGLISKAPENMKEIYLQGVPLDRWGTNLAPGLPIGGDL